MTNGDAHPFGRWLACPTCASGVDLLLMTDAEGTIRCEECETILNLTEIPAFLKWVQCPACGFDSTVKLSLDSAGELRIECSDCSHLYRAGEGGGDPSA